MAMIWILPALCALILGGAYYAYRIAFFSPKAGRDKLPSTDSPVYDPYRAEMKRIFHQLNDRPCEFVTVRSRDGLLLSGRYYHIRDGAPLDIGFHGYRSSPMTDFTGGSELSFSLGHNVLLVDQRAHGRSEGSTIAFGLLERQDLLCWVEYALQRFGEDQQIILYGISMGGATVLMASELALPSNVRGIIADCPYANALEIILHVGKTMPIPGWLMKPFVILGARIFGGFDLLQTDALRAVRKASVPILLIHGEADTFVPQEMSEAIALANPALVERHTVPGAEHGISYLVDSPRYRRIVTDFLSRIL